jgi:hypothetical protein
MPLSIRDLSTSFFCFVMAGCQSVPSGQSGMEQPKIPIRSPTEIANDVDPVDSQTVIYLKQVATEPAKVKTHIFRWPFTKECALACGTMWTLSALAVGITIGVINSHHDKKGCITKVVTCATWPDCTYPPPAPGCTYDFGG